MSTSSVIDASDALELEAIHVFREVAGEFDRPVILFSGGKDSTLLVHLAVKAFATAPVPFPLLHVDTGHNSPEVIAFRDELAGRLNLRLEVAHVEDYFADGRLTERADGTRNPLQTQPLLDAIAEHRFDAVFGGGRRNEERARAKERVMRCATRSAAGTRASSARSCGTSTTAGTPRVSTSACSRSRTGPSWTSGATSSARASSCPASTSRTSARCSGATACGWPRAPGAARAVPRRWSPLSVRYRTVGDGSCTGAVESTAVTLDEVIDEMTASRLTERARPRSAIRHRSLTPQEH